MEIAELQRKLDSQALHLGGAIDSAVAQKNNLIKSMRNELRKAVAAYGKGKHHVVEYQLDLMLHLLDLAEAE